MRLTLTVKKYKKNLNEKNTATLFSQNVYPSHETSSSNKVDSLLPGLQIYSAMLRRNSRKRQKRAGRTSETFSLSLLWYQLVNELVSIKWKQFFSLVYLVKNTKIRHGIPFVHNVYITCEKQSTYWYIDIKDYLVIQWSINNFSLQCQLLVKQLGEEKIKNDQLFLIYHQILITSNNGNV